MLRPGPDKKRQKMMAEATKARAAASAAPGNVIIQFASAEGEDTGSQMDVPSSVSTQQLETLLNGMLGSEEKLPYSFQIEDQELRGELGEHLQKHSLSVEKALKIVYQPQAVFRVRAVCRCTSSMPGHSEAVLAVAFSPNGRMLASGSGDTTVRFWDLNMQLPQHECTGHRNWVLAVAWSPDACYVASGDMDGAVWLWDPKTGDTLGQCTGHKKWITSISWEPAHKRLPAARFATGSKDSTVKVWDAATRQCVLSFSNHSQAVTAVKWGGEGLIYSASRDSTISAWDASDGKLVRVFKGHGHWVNTLALSSEHALRTGAFDHTGSAPADSAAAQAQALTRYQAATGGQPERMVSGSDDLTMFMWHPSASKQPVARMSGHQQLVNQVQFSPDGRYVLSASFDKSVKLWDGVKGNFIATFRNHVGPVYQVAWSSDSRMFVSGSRDSTLKVWDISRRQIAIDLPGHADEIFCVDWAPDGSFVASGGKDRVLKLWRH